ncbi:TonB-dependent receptor domain-containing protein [Luteimonas sp. SDU101]|uniref:TonB-dependent receptor domain-containing protein n=1 Tax=Luteimonas sp. SDU101 TaxID=3422593 RepID=UPI003EBA9310
MRQTRLLKGILLAVACTAAASAMAQAPTSQRVDVPAGDLAAAVELLRQQTGGEILFRADQLRGTRTRGVRGDLVPAEALDRLLEGTGFSTERDSSGAVFIVPSSSQPARAEEPQSQAAPGALTAQGEVVGLSSVTVTGTRIRGGATPSSVITIGSERIREEGFTDLGEVVRSLPQNFSGGQGPGIAPGATGGGQGNQNITGGSGLNLRGLGQDATLTLLNGRRMSYGGFVQMVDISAIPVEAVERIEVVADGASAIYGSDAVGGVGNVILRRDFDGVAVGARYGAATDGGLATREATATGGAIWRGGGLIATWKTSRNDPIRADQRRYAEGMYAPTTLYQEGDLRSCVLSAYQALGEAGELRVDALASERAIVTEMAYATHYERSTPETEASLLSPSAEFFLPGGWTLSLGGTWGRERTDAANATVMSSGGTTMPTRTLYRNLSRSHELGVEGPLGRAPGGEARLAAGVGYRHNGFETRYPDSGYTQADGDVRSRFAYAEVEIPLVGPGQGVAGAYRMALTAAVRGEDYDHFGSVTTPKLGVVYGPGRDVTFKASWGRSFKVPTLSQQFLQRDAILFPAIALGGAAYPPDATVLYLVGGNPELAPERARTWSASLALHPSALPGLEAEITWFDIDYTDRVVQPLVPAQALSNPAFAEFLQPAPGAEALDELLRAFRFTNATGTPIDAARIAAVVPNLYVNSARQRVRGADVSGGYRFELAGGRLALRGGLAWLDGTRRISAGQPALDVAGTLFHPAEINGRAGAVWSRGGFTSSLFGNYRSGVRDPTDGAKGASFTTFDATLRYDTGVHAGVLSDLALELTVQNALDRAPPLYAVTSPTFAPYDSTNYSAIGRFAALSVSKRW